MLLDGNVTIPGVDATVPKWTVAVAAGVVLVAVVLVAYRRQGSSTASATDQPNLSLGGSPGGAGKGGGATAPPPVAPPPNAPPVVVPTQPVTFGETFDEGQAIGGGGTVQNPVGKPVLADTSAYSPITPWTAPAVPDPYWNTPAGQAAEAWYRAHPGAGAAEYVAAHPPAATPWNTGGPDPSRYYPLGDVSTGFMGGFDDSGASSGGGSPATTGNAFNPGEYAEP